MKNQSDIGGASPNLSVPFFPSSSWYVTSYVDPETINPQNVKGPYFGWIQVRFGTGVTDPVLAVYSGVNDANGDPIVSPVAFAYSGETKPFKGVQIVASGKDRNGETVTSTDIADFTEIIVYGGTQ